jgi:hypothetical protein
MDRGVSRLTPHGGRKSTAAGCRALARFDGDVLPQGGHTVTFGCFRWASSHSSTSDRRKRRRFPMRKAGSFPASAQSTIVPGWNPSRSAISRAVSSRSLNRPPRTSGGRARSPRRPQRGAAQGCGDARGGRTWRRSGRRRCQCRRGEAGSGTRNERPARPRRDARFRPHRRSRNGRSPRGKRYRRYRRYLPLLERDSR